ncbi:MAG: serine/threonine protein kinase [Oscillatoriales cyanobacterium C42_A2020_001]|nr:serine/threonine protein kinase [Leptolyngbyaceae cyanobacterium C42_A2020_001]
MNEPNYRCAEGWIGMIGKLLTGRYLILEELGAGGFSKTYLARDKYLPHHPLCVVKYLKLSSRNKISLETAQQLFDNEARLLEQVGRHHSQIPTLYAYCHEHDEIYLVQEYVEGESLSRWLQTDQRLSYKVAIALLKDVLTILEHIHSYGIIHRDIKPSNLIRRRDGKFVLIDFGAACLVSNPEPSALPTTASLAIGTPGYMPDEQHLGMSRLNSDLYALGILVIHLLTKVHPKQFKPDVISGELDWHSFLPEHCVDPRLVEVLDRLVRIKCSDRYQHPAEALADIQAIPGVGHFRQPAICWQRSVKKMVAPVTALLVLGMVGGQYVYARNRQSPHVLSQIEHLFQQSDVHLKKLRDMPIQADVEQMLITPNNQMLITAGNDHVLRLWSLATGSMLRSISGHTSVTSLAISQDSKLLVSGGADGVVRLWDTSSGQFLQVFRGHQKPVTSIAIHPDGQTLITGCKGGMLRRWDLKTGVLLQTLQLPKTEITAVSYGSIPNSLISATSDRQLQVWDLRTGALHRTFAGHTDAIVGLQVTNQQRLISFGKDRGLMWDLKREELMEMLPKDSANPIATSFSDRYIITVHENGSIRIWTRDTGKLVAKNNNGSHRNRNAALSPDHRYLASWDTDRRLHLWQVSTTKL